MNFSLSGINSDSRLLRYVLLGAILLLVVIVHLFYLHFDGRSFPDHDMGFTKSFFNIYHQAYSDYSLHSLITYIFQEQPPYPFINSLLAGLAFIIPPSWTLYKLFTLVFYILLILAGYRIGERLANKQVGLLCAFVLATLPIFDNHSRKFDLQFHAAAITLWTYYYALTIFKAAWTYRHSVILGLLIGIAVTTHPTAVVNLAPLMLFLPLFTMTKGKNTGGRWVKSILIVVMAFLPILLFLQFFIGSYLVKAGTASVLSGFSTSTSIYARWQIDYFRDSLAISLGHFYLKLLVAATFATILSLWLNKSRRFYHAFLLFSASWAFAAMLAAYPAGLFPEDFMFFYALITPLLIAEIHSLLAIGNRYRLVRCLSIVLVLTIIIGGIWTKIQALRILPPEKYIVEPVNFSTELRVLLLTRDFGRDLSHILCKSETPDHFTFKQMKILQEGETFRFVYDKNENDMFYIMRNIGLLCGKIVDLHESNMQLFPRYRLYLYQDNQPLSAKKIAAIMRQIKQLNPDAPPQQQYIFSKYCARLTVPMQRCDYLFVLLQKVD